MAIGIFNPNPDQEQDNRPIMRAKMVINSVHRTAHAEEVVMNPVCKTGGYPEDGWDEDNTFARFSPSGELKLIITNPSLWGVLNPGEKYYLDFTVAKS